METIYYWVGAIIFWLIMVPITSVSIVMGWVFLHRDLMKRHKWYRQGIELQLLPLYVRLAMSHSSAGNYFMVKIKLKPYQKQTHLRVLVNLLNYVHSFKKPW